MRPSSWLTRKSTPTPIAIHYGGDCVRMMQLQSTTSPSLHCAMEVPSDGSGIAEAMNAFHGRKCVLGLPSSAVLLQHIRVSIDASEKEIHEQLIPHDVRWGDAEIRSLCVTTTGGAKGQKQELLCLGVERNVLWQYVDRLEHDQAEITAVTVPIYASIRAFDQLHRRSEDENQTIMLVDFDDKASMVMIAHGGNCVFANKFIAQAVAEPKEWEPTPSLKMIPMPSTSSERRGDYEPRGLRGVQENHSDAEQHLSSELERCLRHHDANFPDHAIDRLIFSGRGATNSDRCSAIATKLGLAGFIADPSAWISGSTEIAGGPAWTTVAGMCLRYQEIAA